MIFHGRPVRRGSARCGFTLLELLVAIGLILALGAVILVPAQAMLERAQFDGDLHRLRGALTECRVLARRLGVSIEVSLEPNQLVARHWTSESTDDESERAPLLTVSLGGTKDETGAPLDDAMLIAVALPDGTFLVDSPLSLADGNGGIGRLLMDPWSGAVLVESP
jgi:prepilin-type N-terminal cleavage/methylation domain-containing protein